MYLSSWVGKKSYFCARSSVFMRYIYYQFPIWIVAVILYSCSAGVSSSPKSDYSGRDDYKVELIDEISKDDVTNGLRRLFPSSDGKSNPSVDAIINSYSHTVERYKVTYKTIFINEEITVSGLLLMPKDVTIEKAICYTHGTIIANDDAPSVGKGTISKTVLPAFAAIAKAVVFAPDYIGYGASKNEPHPYEHMASLGKTTLDMIEVMGDYVRNKLDKDALPLYLTGYSEGGYAAVAVHKLYEETDNKREGTKVFTLTRTIAGSGAYDKLGFADTLLNKRWDQGLNFLPYYYWVLHAYKSIYNWSESHADLFSPDVKSKAEKINYNPRRFIETYKGTNPPWKPSTFFSDSFRKGVNNRNHAIHAAFKENTIISWAPEAKLTLVYGLKDDFVFPLNSINAFNSMKARGGKIDRRAVPDGDHFSTLQTYYAEVIDQLELFPN